MCYLVGTRTPASVDAKEELLTKPNAKEKITCTLVEVDHSGIISIGVSRTGAVRVGTAHLARHTTLSGLGSLTLEDFRHGKAHSLKVVRGARNDRTKGRNGVQVVVARTQQNGTARCDGRVIRGERRRNGGVGNCVVTNEIGRAAGRSRHGRSEGRTAANLRGRLLPTISFGARTLARGRLLRGIRSKGTGAAPRRDAVAATSVRPRGQNLTLAGRHRKDNTLVEPGRFGARAVFAGRILNGTDSVHGGCAALRTVPD